MVSLVESGLSFDRVNISERVALNFEGHTATKVEFLPILVKEQGENSFAGNLYQISKRLKVFVIRPDWPDDRLGEK